MSVTIVRTKVSNWLVAATLLAALSAAFAGLLAPPATAANCDGAPSGPGDWTVGATPETCSNIVVVMDGDLIVNNVLTIVNGGMKFTQDATHRHGITIGSGGTLRLVNSQIWTEARMINPYLQLNVSISGRLEMLNSTLAFPGSLTTTTLGPRVVNLTDSTIRGPSVDVTTIFSDAYEQDDNNDAPALTFSGATVHLFNSSLEDVYENLNSGDDPRQAIRLESGTTFTAIDSFLAVDFYNNSEQHNTLDVSGGSRAYLYGVTFDTAENPDYQDEYIPAINVTGSSEAAIYRWGDISVVDFNQRPVAGAEISPWYAGPDSGCASFRDTGPSCNPPSAVVWYMGKTPGTWDHTDTNGTARLPLLSDWINSTTMPNSRFVGSYNLIANWPPAGAYQGETPLTLGAYPGMDDTNRSRPATVRLSTLVQPFPELTITTVSFVGGNGALDLQPLNRPLTIRATVNNTGDQTATNVIVNFYSVDVDANPVDGYMDETHTVHALAGEFIGSSSPLTVNASGSRVLTGTWTPQGTIEGQRIVSAFVDPETGANPRAGGTISELNEANNLFVLPITTFVWADLQFDSFPQIILNPPVPIANNPVQVSLTVRNNGTSDAIDASFGIFDAVPPNPPRGAERTIALIPRGATAQLDLEWLPPAAGLQTIRIWAFTSGSTGFDPDEYHNFDFDAADVPSDNYRDRQFTVLSPPELSISAPAPHPSPFRGQPFSINVTISNTGGSQASGIVVAVVDRTISPAVELGTLTLDVPAGAPLDREISNLQAIDTSGVRTIEVIVDHQDEITEIDETNNNRTIQITVRAPSGSITVPTSPLAGHQVAPGTTLVIQAAVRDTATLPIADVRITAQLRQGLVDIANETGTSGADGLFYIFLQVPSNAPLGRYDLILNAEDASILDRQLSVTVAHPLAWWQSPFLGLPVWIWLIVAIGAIAAIGGGTAYLKFVGLGKLVECGECGAFISEDSTQCPKCGVEFEKDMAKCSNCQAWIPADVKQCPECGVEFTTGEVGMEDYETKMRSQYDEVKRRFRQEASQELGRELNDREFEDWWRTQQTFVTFEDWLKEEEDMRRMGSKPCPVCTTLNSVTAVVCHKCGALLKETKEKAGAAPTEGAARPVAQAEAGAGAEEGAEGAPGEAVPKKVVRKPVGAPVVQKKVIKRPVEEPKEGTDDEPF